MTNLLHGVKILDLSNIIAGPLCTYQLALMGADVTKVERPGTGDLSRKMGMDPARGQIGMGVSYLAMNAGKKSITLNLQHETGRDIFKRLTEDADVVFENFRPGVMARLGLGFEDLKAIQPGLIYCAVSGFGQDGPLAARPAYDQIIQGYSGLMSLTGPEEGDPYRAGYTACDAMGAMTAAFAVTAALFRQRQTGEGAFIDVSMLDATLTSMASWVVSNHLNAGNDPQRLGNESHSAAPSGSFPTKDGQINIVNNEQKQFEMLCDAIDRPDLKSHELFADRDERFKNKNALRAELIPVLATKTSAEWEELLSAAGIPAAQIYTVPEILRHAHTDARGILESFDSVPGTDQGATVATRGYRLIDEPVPASTPPPRLGEHTDDVLESLGYDQQAIAALRDDGII
ncbi:MAG: CoA transferase [Rhodospirillaceae bacterium]|nr:CoA transferase [Rhodospirillaceae bacterium]HAA91252.1 CoA transferase [Rhodospirillaceae bacterium]